MALDLGKQVGPLPLGAWIAAVGGGLYFMYSRKGSSSAATDTTANTTTDTSGGTGTGVNGEWVDVNPPDSTSGNPTYQTNEQWGTAAINWLIAQGYDPGLSNSAINKGLAGGQDSSGNKMSVTEWSLWSLALQHLGSPPSPVSVPPPTSVPPPAGSGGGGTNKPPVTSGPGGGSKPPPVVTPVGKPTTNKTPRHHTYIVKRNDTLSGIAKKYGTTWQTIWNFNLKYRSSSAAATLKKRGPNLLVAGETIWVPY